MLFPGLNFQFVFCQTDIYKAFDTIFQSVIFEMLEATDMDPILKHNISLCFTGQIFQILFDGKKCNPICMGRGIKQGRCDSMDLFCKTVASHLDPLIAKWHRLNFGVHFGNHLVNILGLADDITLIANNVKDLVSMVKDVQLVLDNIGLTIGENKCKYLACQCFGPDELHINGIRIPRKHNILVLGCYISDDGSSDADVDYKIERAYASFYKHIRILWSNYLSNQEKISVLVKCILPAMLFGDPAIFVLNTAIGTF